MRRFCVVFIYSVLIQVLAPTPVHAWWDWVEQLSGPGPMTGFDVEGRVLCIARRPDGTLAPRAVGGIFTVCKLEPGERRLASFDVGFRWVWDAGDPRFANGKRIHMLSLQPAFSWNFIESSRYDFVEYGFGAGSYWFRSSEFDTFSGMIVEPLRLDFRLPTDIHNAQPWWRRVVVRYSLLWFPSGFEPQQFASAPGVMEIHDRATNSISIFFDVGLSKSAAGR